MTIHILTLFPDYFKALIELSIVGRAHRNKLVTTNIVNIRDFGIGAYKKVDDTPFGGGAGMVLMIEPVDKALASLGITKGQKNSKIILTSARGELFTQQTARTFAKFDTITFICGHYEGVDQRIADYLVDEEVSIGNYVLSGGEPAVNVMADAIVRLLPGALGNASSTIAESHDSPGKISPPQYTRPEIYNGLTVPSVLLSGNHKDIQKWKANQRTKIS